MKLYLNALFFAFICLFQMNATLKVYEAVPSEDSPYAGREIYLLPTMHHKAFKSLSRNTQNFLTEIQEADGRLLHEVGGSASEEWLTKLMEFEAEDQDKYIEFCQQPAVKEVIDKYVDEYEDMSKEQILASPLFLTLAKFQLNASDCYEEEDSFDCTLIDEFKGKSLELENLLESLYHFMNRKGEDNKISYDTYAGVFKGLKKVLPEQIKAVEDLYEAQDLLTYSVPQLNEELGQKLGIEIPELKPEDDFFLSFRNKSWIEKLPSLFEKTPEDSPILIAAGMMHFLKNDGTGLFEYFEAQGCELRLMEPCHDSLS